MVPNLLLVGVVVGDVAVDPALAVVVDLEVEALVEEKPRQQTTPVRMARATNQNAHVAAELPGSLGSPKPIEHVWRKKSLKESALRRDSLLVSILALQAAETSLRALLPLR